MKHIDALELLDAVVLPKRWTRKEKLTRWAELVRKHKGEELALFHELEYLRPYQLKEIRPSRIHVNSAFLMAVRDPALNEQGLSQEASLADIMRFFELSQDELHLFSCDCGGYISNRGQANRIAALASK